MNSESRPALLRLSLWLALALGGYIVLIRLLPYLTGATGPGTYLWNFSPVMAICLFGGARFFRGRNAWLVSLGAFFVADLAILALQGPAFAFTPVSILVYAGFAVGILLGRKLRGTSGLVALAGTGLAAETVFFILTNLGVWLVYRDQPPVLYSFNLQGLIHCYVNALPFFGRSLLSTLIYGTLLFGSWAAVSRYAEAQHALARVVVRRG